MVSILVADEIAEEGVVFLRNQTGYRVEVRTGLKEAALCECAADFDAIIVRSATKITRPVFEAAKQLKAVGRAGIGVDNIDVEAATEHGVVVINTLSAAAPH